MDELIKTLNEVIENDGCIFTCGNGGSASTAEHFTNDLFSVGARAICLNSNVSLMTMIANDYGYDEVFSRQFDRLVQDGDMLICFSVSGKSKNILKVLDIAKHWEIDSFIFLGDTKDFGKSEDEHLTACHKITKAVK